MNKVKGITLVDPDKKLVSVDPSEVQKALDMGYRHAEKQDIEVHNYLEDNKGISGAVKVALAQASDEALMGIPETMMDYTDTPLEKAKRDAIKEQHDIANTVGGLTGFAASMFYGGAIGKVGVEGLGLGTKLASKIVGSKIANAAINAGAKISENEIGKVAMGVAGKMVTAGAEGTALMTPQAVTEASFGDYDNAAETLLAGGLMGAAFSGAIDLIKGVPRGIGYINKNLKGIAGIKSDVDKMAETLGVEQNLIGANKNTNIAELQAALDRQGMTGTSGMLSGNMILRGVESSLAQSPSIAGNIVRGQLDKVYTPLKKMSEEILTPSATRTLYETGDQAQKQLISRIAEKQQISSDLYGRLESQYGTTILPQEVRDIAKKELSNLDAVRLGPGKGMAKTIESYIDNVQTVDDIKKLRTYVGGLYSPVAPAIERQLIDSSYDIFTKMRTNSLESIANKNKSAEGLALVKEADASYRSAMAEFKPLDDMLGGRESKSLGQISNKITEMNAETISKKLFNTNDYKSLEILKNNFPEVFDTVKAAKVNELYEKSLYKGEISPNKFSSTVDRLPEEVKLLMFGEEYIQKIKDIKTIMNSMPEKIGPSGTPQGEAFMNFLKIPFQLQEGARYLAYKRPPKVGAALGLIEKTMKHTANSLDNFEKYISKPGKISMSKRQAAVVGTIRMFDERDKEKRFSKVSDVISQLSTDDNARQGMNAVYEHIASNGAPNIALAYQQNTIAAIRYLQENMPKRLSEPGLFGNKDWKPSDYQMAKFERQIDAIDHPFGILEDFKNGELTKDKVEAVKAIYPKLYDQIRNRTIKIGIDSGFDGLEYNRKMQLALLLDMPFVKINELAMYQKSYIDNLDQITNQQGTANKKAEFNAASFAETELDKTKSRS